MLRLGYAQAFGLRATLGSLLINRCQESVLLFLQEVLAVVLADAAESLVTQLTHTFVGDIHGFAHFAECLRSFLVDAENAGDDSGFAFRELFHEVTGQCFDALDFGIGFRV